MPAVYGAPADIPCVRCGQLPTVGYCWAGVEGDTGRVCATHASELADRDGLCVVGDGGHVENWGRV